MHEHNATRPASQPSRPARDAEPGEPFTVRADERATAPLASYLRACGLYGSHNARTLRETCEGLHVPYSIDHGASPARTVSLRLGALGWRVVGTF